MSKRKQPGTGFSCRLVFGSKAEKARNEYAEGVSVGLARHHADDRLLPMPYFVLDDSKRGSDLILAHDQRRGTEGRERNTLNRTGESVERNAYSGLRFDNHF